MNRLGVAATDVNTTPMAVGGWDRFWFLPSSPRRIAGIRGSLCLLTIIYFASCWSDVAFWYGEHGPLQSQRVATFLQTAGLEDAGRWIVSPLFLTESLLAHRVYLVVGMVSAMIVMTGRGGRALGCFVWLLLVGWANRSMILSGLTETLLSLGLFASAIAPPAAVSTILPDQTKPGSVHWTSRFAERLMALQITIVGLATMATMLAGRVWFNGIGAYALAAPVENRTLDWTDSESLFAQPMVHELVTHLLVIALPAGFLLAWLPKTSPIGKIMLVAWCVAVACLGSHWLYAAAFATMLMAIVPDRPSGSENELPG